MWTDNEDYRFMVLALDAAHQSAHPQFKVGCVIVDKYGEVVGTGYNHPPAPLDQPAKLEGYDGPSATVHSEVWAALEASTQAKGGTAFVTQPPCVNCAIALGAAGVQRIVWLAPDASLLPKWGENLASAKNLLARANISTREISTNDRKFIRTRAKFGQTENN